MLPPRPTAGGRAGVNRPFYRAFAAAYALARTRSHRPGVLLRASNPGLSASQCREYLKRARVLGFVPDEAAGEGAAYRSLGAYVPGDEPPAATPARSAAGVGPVGELTAEQAAWVAQARAVLAGPAPTV